MKKIHVVRKDEESIEVYEKVEITPEGIKVRFPIAARPGS